jgi:hypothetical protein
LFSHETIDRGIVKAQLRNRDLDPSGEFSVHAVEELL